MQVRKILIFFFLAVFANISGGLLLTYPYLKLFLTSSPILLIAIRARIEENGTKALYIKIENFVTDTGY